MVEVTTVDEFRKALKEGRVIAKKDIQAGDDIATLEGNIVFYDPKTIEIKKSVGKKNE